MSNENRETVADIVAWIRRHASVYGYDLADRIEAAHKREREATCKESLRVGNVAEMREALKKAMRVLHCSIVAEILNGEDAHEALNAVTTALSAPARNCDVGTVEEQSERYHALCDSNKCTSCPCKFTVRTYCALIWAHMPYEEAK